MYLHGKYSHDLMPKKCVLSDMFSFCADIVSSDGIIYEMLN